MRSIKIFLIFLFFVTGLALAQEKLSIQKELQEKSSSSESYPVDVRPYLERFNKANGIDEKKIGEEMQQSVLHKTTAWNFKVLDKKNWIASDLRDNTFYSTPSTCRAVGTNCYVFVEDSLWTNRVNQTVVDGVKNAFDNSTPANASKGIYQTNVETFGNPPNVDGDAKIIIFILNIRDGYSGPPAGYVAGYFHSVNEITNPSNSNYANSNKAEIYYLDANPANLTTSTGLQRGMATTAHEFQHMIHFNYISPAETFFNESWSLAAEVICGYPLYTQSYYNGETNQYLLNWRRDDNTLVLNDYSRAAKFGLYLYEQYGASIFKNYLANKINGVTGIENILLNLSSPTDFKTTVSNWWVANYLNDKSVSPGLTKWGYNYSNIIKVTPKTIINPNVSNASDAVYKLAAQYVSYTSGKNLKINFNTLGNSGIKIKAIKTGTSSKAVDDVTPGMNYSVPEFGNTYNNVTFMVYHDNRNEFSQGTFAYSYTSTGTYEKKAIEIAYDLTEPTGYLPLTPGDSVAVHFDGVSGMRLDSIKVALRGVTPINGSVYEYLGLASQLGGKKLASFIATPTLSQAPPSPYPVPWPNWVKIDLRSNNIDASKSFVVELPVGAAYPSSNRVMSTDYRSTASYHSFAYMSTQSPPRWGYYSVFGKDGYIFLYLIRAYVSDFTTGVEKVIELMPSSFSLNQNYPNPFNPSTVISYQLPVAGHVSLKVYDMLGREVATLVDEFQQAGSHNSQFSIQNSQFSSGIYFYTIRAGNFVETKKMVLMK